MYDHRSERMMKMKCSICGKEIKGYGNNAFPVGSGHCCDECNGKVVIPYRLFLGSAGSKKQGLLITTNYELKLVKQKGDKFTLKELQDAVGGYIEIVASPFPGYICIVDEEGKLRNKKPNNLAYLILGQELVGDILVIPNKLLD